MTKGLILLIFSTILLPGKGFSQNKYLLGSVWGLPLFQSGFGYGNLGFEYQEKNNNTAWQFSFNMAGGSIATDIGETKRKWITLDRIISFKKRSFSTKPFFFTFFLEAGDRKKSPGHIFISDTTINQYRAFELNPGIGLGKYIKLTKRINLQLIAAPKTILAFHNDRYYDQGNKNYFFSKYSDINIGFRLAANFCFRL